MLRFLIYSAIFNAAVLVNTFSIVNNSQTIIRNTWRELAISASPSPCFSAVLGLKTFRCWWTCPANQEPSFVDIITKGLPLSDHATMRLGQRNAVSITGTALSAVSERTPNVTAAHTTRIIPCTLTCFLPSLWAIGVFWLCHFDLKFAYIGQYDSGISYLQNLVKIQIF